jgi:hypothetical protein
MKEPKKENIKTNSKTEVLNFGICATVLFQEVSASSGQ